MGYVILTCSVIGVLCGTACAPIISNADLYRPGPDGVICLAVAQGQVRREVLPCGVVDEYEAKYPQPKTTEH